MTWTQFEVTVWVTAIVWVSVVALIILWAQHRERRTP